MNTPCDGIATNEPAIGSPELERLLKANHELWKNARICARLAAKANPAGLPVSDGYIDALDQFNTALADRGVHIVREASRRYISTFDLLSGRIPADAAGGALLDAVVTLGLALKSVDNARTKVPPGERML